MKKVFCDKIQRIAKNRRMLEKTLGIKISNAGNEVSITGNPENEYYAEMVIEAIDMGFPLEVALSIKEEGNSFEKINVKDYAKRRDFRSVRARIIGKGGKTLRVLSELTGCHFEIRGNDVGIVGEPERMKNAQDALISIIKGTRQANVYSFLEKRRSEPIIDLGLKGSKKTKD
jgi:KH domain-containing protein